MLSGFILLTFSSADLRRIFIHASPSQANTLEAGWSLKILASVGVPYMSVLNSFERLADESQGGLMGGGADRRRDQLDAIISLLDAWVSAAAQFSSEQAAHEVCTHIPIHSFACQPLSCPSANSIARAPRSFQS